MGVALGIRTDLASPARLRGQARRERSPRTAARMLAVANAMEGMGRAEAAWLAGMERQALRDAVVRFNAEGLAGLCERFLSHRVLDGYDAIVAACCETWNALTPERLRACAPTPGSGKSLHKLGGIRPSGAPGANGGSSGKARSRGVGAEPATEQTRNAILIRRAGLGGYA